MSPYSNTNGGVRAHFSNKVDHVGVSSICSAESGDVEHAWCAQFCVNRPISEGKDACFKSSSVKSSSVVVHVKFCQVKSNRVKSNQVESSQVK